MEEMMLTNLWKTIVQLFLKTNKQATEGDWLKILPPKQIFQRLPIALAQVKASNNSENLWNEIWEIVCFLNQSKEITKKVHNNIIKSIQI